MNIFSNQKLFKKRGKKLKKRVTWSRDDILDLISFTILGHYSSKQLDKSCFFTSKSKQEVSSKIQKFQTRLAVIAGFFLNAYNFVESNLRNHKTDKQKFDYIRSLLTEQFFCCFKNRSDPDDEDYSFLNAMKSETFKNKDFAWELQHTLGESKEHSNIQTCYLNISNEFYDFLKTTMTEDKVICIDRNTFLAYLKYKQSQIKEEFN